MADSNGAAELVPQRPGPPAVPAEDDELARLRDENKATIMELARDHQTGLDPLSLLRMKFEILADLLLSGLGRREYDLRVERTLAQTLESILVQVGQAKLAAGTNLSPSEIAALDRQQRSMVKAAHGLAEHVSPFSDRNRHDKVPPR